MTCPDECTDTCQCGHPRRTHGGFQKFTCGFRDDKWNLCDCPEFQPVTEETTE